MAYGMALNDSPWKTLYPNISHMSLSPCGQHTAASVQVQDLTEGDIHTFKKGIYTVAVDGNAWEETSGIYFCVLESGNSIKVEKLILLK